MLQEAEQVDTRVREMVEIPVRIDHIVQQHTVSPESRIREELDQLWAERQGSAAVERNQMGGAVPDGPHCNRSGSLSSRVCSGDSRIVVSAAVIDALGAAPSTHPAPHIGGGDPAVTVGDRRVHRWSGPNDNDPRESRRRCAVGSAGDPVRPGR